MILPIPGLKLVIEFTNIWLNRVHLPNYSFDQSLLHQARPAVSELIRKSLSTENPGADTWGYVLS